MALATDILAESSTLRERAAIAAIVARALPPLLPGIVQYTTADVQVRHTPRSNVSRPDVARKLWSISLGHSKVGLEFLVHSGDGPKAPTSDWPRGVEHCLRLVGQAW